MFGGDDEDRGARIGGGLRFRSLGLCLKAKEKKYVKYKLQGHLTAYKSKALKLY